jgi:hypothetical protein
LFDAHLNRDGDALKAHIVFSFIEGKTAEHLPLFGVVPDHRQIANFINDEQVIRIDRAALRFSKLGNSAS